MKTLKLIVLMLLTANFVIAQTSTGDNAGIGGNARSAYYGLNAGKIANGDDNVFIGGNSGVNVTGTDAKYNTAIGVSSLSNTTSFYNVAVGMKAGRITTSSSNVFIGALSGEFVQTGNNTIVGYAAMRGSEANPVTGTNNLAMGSSAGLTNTSGSSNVFIGPYAGQFNTTGSDNMYLGNAAGTGNGTGNIAIGRSAGNANDGSYSLFMGTKAGRDIAAPNYKLCIQMDPSDQSLNPLIYGEFPENGTNAGKVAINYDRIPLEADGVTPYTFAVNGKAIVEELQVMVESSWPDYVFTEDYNLMSLTDLEAEIETLGHLPGVPSAEEVEENGHALGQMDAILLEKIEELTLHLIDMNKEMEKLRERNETLETRLSEVEDK